MEHIKPIMDRSIRKKKLEAACKAFDYYFPYRNHDPYFYKQWVKANYRLEKLLEN